MIKPDAFGAGNSGAILKMIEEAGFKIIALKKTQLNEELAGEFYRQSVMQFYWQFPLH